MGDWISVDDRLPERYKVVKVKAYIDFLEIEVETNGSISQDEFGGDQLIDFWSLPEYYEYICFVSHWKPL